MTDEQIVAAWAAQCKISAEAVEQLAAHGFTSMDRDDLKRSKLPTDICGSAAAELRNSVF